MKLTTHSVPIIIAQFLLFVHLYAATSTTTTTTTTTDQETTTTEPTSQQQDENYFEISQESRKIIIEQAKESLLKVLGLKEVPKRKPKKKAIVPVAMLEEYIKLRDSVRETIPEDRDFYGKINIHELEKRHVDLWSGGGGGGHNKYSSYDIEVDMDDDDFDYSPEIIHRASGGGKGFLYKGDYERLAFVKPQSEPEDVPKKFEHILPPHLGGINSQKPYISVHLKFNLSQELSSNPLTIDELQAAELHLSRERIVDSGGYYDQHQHSSEPLFKRDTNLNRGQIINNNEKIQNPTAKKNGEENDEGDINISSRESFEQESSSPTTPSEPSLSIPLSTISSSSSTPEDVAFTSPKNRLERRPRYQRLYVLHVLGYDKHNEPMTRIHDSQIIDTHQSTPLMLDIYLIVKRWIMNPADNYGIIVRVTNEDKNYEVQGLNGKQSQKRTASLDNDNTTNASITVTNTTIHTSSSSKAPDSSEQTEQKPQPAPDPAAIAESASTLQVMDHVRLKRQFRSSSEIEEVWYQKQPSIYIFSSSPDASRRHVKRNTGTTTGGTARSLNRSRGGAGGGGQKKGAKGAAKCSRRPLEINFDEVGWSSWIIAPGKYLANFCSGDCSFPMNDMQNATNHAIIQSIFHSVGRVVPKSCCAPTKLGTMAILYQIDGIVQMRSYDDMMVESCGCV